MNGSVIVEIAVPLCIQHAVMHFTATFAGCPVAFAGLHSTTAIKLQLLCKVFSTREVNPGSDGSAPVERDSGSCFPILNNLKPVVAIDCVLPMN